MKIVESERLYLRRFKTDDAGLMSRIYSDAEVMKYIGRGGPADLQQTSDMLNAFIESYDMNGYGIMAVIEKHSGKLIGHCGFNLLKMISEVEIAYLLSKEYWGKGYATEIAEAALEYGFNVLKLKKIIALAYPENSASINVIKKLGMKSEGLKEFYGISFMYFMRSVK